MANRNGAASNGWRRVAMALGWFSVGLGVAQIVAPRQLARAIGVKHRPLLFRLLGMREVTSGLGILSRSRPAPWVASRIAGDAMDLGLLGAALRARHTRSRRVAMAAAAVAGVSVVDLLCSRKLTPNNGRGRQFIRTIIIDRTPEELYRFWRSFENLPQFMTHLRSVRVIDAKRSEWVAKGPLGMRVKWQAEITEDIPDEMISWRSIGGDVDTTGTVEFERAPGGRGTMVRVTMEYAPPGGMAGRAVAKVSGQSPEHQLSVDLRQFKQLMETGELARTEGQSAGRSRSTSRKYDEPVRA